MIRRLRSMRYRWALIAPIALLIAALHAAAVTAHAEYRSSVPANGATVTTAPTQVVITFSQETSATKSNGSVNDASGTVVSTGWSVDLNERTKMTIPLTPTLPNGIYTVNYTSLSQDDHQVDGSFIFTVDPAATNTVAAAASTGGGAPWGLWLAIFSATTVVIAGGFFLLRARTEHRVAAHTAPSREDAAGDDAPRPRDNAEKN